MTLKALIFDVDGTLADTERDGHRVAFNRAFAELGLSWQWDEDLYGRLLSVTGGKERIRYYVSDFLEGPAPERLDALVPELHAAKTRHYVAMLAEGSVGLRPGVVRLLREAKAAGLKLAVATTTTPENVTALLDSALGTEPFFDVIAAGDVVPAKKPAPDIYVLALRDLGLAAVDCLAFEDSDNGIRSSLGAGLKTVVTVNAYTRGQSFDGAALVLDSLGEPDLPFGVLAGDAHGKSYFDLDLAQHLLA